MEQFVQEFGSDGGRGYPMSVADNMIDKKHTSREAGKDLGVGSGNSAVSNVCVLFMTVTGLTTKRIPSFSRGICTSGAMRFSETS